MILWILSDDCPEKPILTEKNHPHILQHMIEAFNAAVKNNHTKTINWFLKQTSFHKSLITSSTQTSDLLILAVQHNNFSLQNWFLSPNCPHKVTSGTLFQAYKYAKEKNNIDMKKNLLRLPYLLDAYHDDIESILKQMCDDKDFKMLEWLCLEAPLLSQQEKNGDIYIRPSHGCLISPTYQVNPKYEVNGNLIFGIALNEHYPIINWLLNLRPDLEVSHKNMQYAFNRAFSQNNLKLVNALFSKQNPTTSDESLYNQVFLMACTQENEEIVHWLLNASHLPRPTQFYVNQAFTVATNPQQLKLGIMSLLLNSNTLLACRPDINLLINGYQSLRGLATELQIARNLIYVSLPENSRVLLDNLNTVTLRQAIHQGVAHEIHNYSNNCLNDVMLNIRGRLVQHNDVSPTVDPVRIHSFLTTIGEQHFSSEQQNNIRRAIGYTLEPGQIPTLIDTYRFVETYYNSQLELWAKSFIEETITAYDNLKNPVSCSKGIAERLVTSLKVLEDEQLNSLFAKPENKLLAEKKLNMLNLEREAHAEQFASALYDAGFRMNTVHTITEENLIQAAYTFFTPDELTPDIQTKINSIAPYMIEDRWRHALQQLEMTMVQQAQNPDDFNLLDHFAGDEETKDAR